MPALLKYMNKNSHWKIRVTLLIFFLILLPLKYGILSLAGTETIGKITALSAPCENGIKSPPQPREMINFYVKDTEHEMLSDGGIQNFCHVKIGDKVQVTYFYLPIFNYMLLTIRNPIADFWIFFGCGILFNCIANLILLFGLVAKNRNDDVNNEINIHPQR